MWCKRRSWDSLIRVKDPCNGEGLIVCRETEFTELEMEYVCIPNIVLEELRELTASWVWFNMSLNVVKTRISKFQSNNMELLINIHMYFYKMINQR